MGQSTNGNDRAARKVGNRAAVAFHNASCVKAFFDNRSKIKRGKSEQQAPVADHRPLYFRFSSTANSNSRRSISTAARTATIDRSIDRSPRWFGRGKYDYRIESMMISSLHSSRLISPIIPSLRHLFQQRAKRKFDRKSSLKLTKNSNRYLERPDKR